MHVWPCLPCSTAPWREVLLQSVLQGGSTRLCGIVLPVAFRMRHATALLRVIVYRPGPSSSTLCVLCSFMRFRLTTVKRGVALAPRFHKRLITVYLCVQRRKRIATDAAPSYCAYAQRRRRSVARRRRSRHRWRASRSSYHDWEDKVPSGSARPHCPTSDTKHWHDEYTTSTATQSAQEHPTRRELPRTPPR